MIVEIYQLPSGHRDLFEENVGRLPEHKRVYVYNLKKDYGTIMQLLEHIYMELNINHPEDFHGHSLSVSDIVRVDGIDYQCEAIGFKML